MYNVRLVAPEENVIQRLFQWFHGKDARMLRCEAKPVTTQLFAQFISRWLPPQGELYGVEIDLEDGYSDVVGFVSFDNWDQRSQTAGIHIFIDREHRRNGIMYQAVRQALEFFFVDGSMYRLNIEIPKLNKQARGLAEKMCAKLEGIKEEARKVGGKRIDLACYRFTFKDYNELLKREREANGSNPSDRSSSGAGRESDLRALQGQEA